MPGNLVANAEAPSQNRQRFLGLDVAVQKPLLECPSRLPREGLSQRLGQLLFHVDLHLMVTPEAGVAGVPHEKYEAIDSNLGFDKNLEIADLDCTHLASRRYLPDPLLER